MDRLAEVDIVDGLSTGVSFAPPELLSCGLAFQIAIDSFTSMDSQSFQYRASRVLISMMT